MRLHVPAAIGGAVLLASCAAQKPAPPPPAPPPPPPAAPVIAAPADWRDLPLAPGEWSWSEGQATFGTGGASLLGLACDVANRTISFTARGAVAPGGRARLTFTASDTTFSYPAVAGDGGIVSRISANDPNVDKLAFSRGRFTIAAPAAGLQQTLLPARPEMTRVIDDCRR